MVTYIEYLTGYIQRHWRGELSLAKSFWFNCILLMLLFRNVQKMLFLFYNLWPWAIVTFIFFVFFHPWTLVGLWRASKSHVKKYNKVFWPRCAQIFVILSIILFVAGAVQGYPSYKNLWCLKFMKGESGKYDLKLKKEGTILCLEGELGFGVSEDIKKILKQNPRITGIVLNTFGGRGVEGIRTADLISHYRLDTYASDFCCSAGTTVFVAGQKRFLIEGTLMGFHRGGVVSDELMLFGEKVSERAEKKLIDAEINFLKHQGIKQTFIEKAMKVPFDDMWFPSINELLEAGVIHGIVDDDFEAIEYNSDYDWAGFMKNELETIIQDSDQD